MNELREILVNGLSGAWSKNIGPIEVLTAYFFCAVLAVYIYVVYLLITKKSFYSKEYNITLVGVALITTGLVVTIQSSLLVSLSVGGALSIIRFRNAIKSTIDTMFLFWSIAIGIMCGSGVALYALILSVVMTITIIILIKMPLIRTPHILVINSNSLNSEEKILSIIKENSKYYIIRSKNITKKTIDMTIEFRANNEEKLISDLNKIKSIDSISILSHNGEAGY